MPRILMHPVVLLALGVVIGAKWGTKIPLVNKVA
jgi:hypothetical protein